MQQIHRAVATGRLAVGEQLPPVRSLAEDLVLNPNTVARAYQELIREGVLESRSSRGIFVTERRQVFSEQERARRLHHAAEQFAHEGLMLGAEAGEMRNVFQETWNALQGEVRQIKRPEK